MAADSSPPRPVASVALVELQSGGHHGFYLRLVNEAFSEMGCEVRFGLNGDSHIRRRLSEQTGPWLAQVPQHFLSSDPRPNRTVVTRELGRWIAEWSPELLFFNSFDLLASSWCRRAALGWRPPAILRGRLAGFYLRPRFIEVGSRGLGNAWKRLGFSKLAREGWFRRLLLVDAGLPDRLRDPAWRSLCWVTPDPWDGDYRISQEEARAIWKLPLDRAVALHFGTGSRRKGLPWVIAALESLPSAERPFLVCAGRLEPSTDLRKQLRRLERAGSARVIDRFLSERERVQIFRAADRLLLAYRGHYGSSGVLVNAAAAGRPVIATDGGLLGRQVQEAHLGITVPEGDIAALAGALRALAMGTAPKIAPQALADFATAHSPSAFKAAIRAACFPRGGIAVNI